MLGGQCGAEGPCAAAAGRQGGARLPRFGAQHEGHSPRLNLAPPPLTVA